MADDGSVGLSNRAQQRCKFLHLGHVQFDLTEAKVQARRFLLVAHLLQRAHQPDERARGRQGNQPPASVDSGTPWLK